jgi:hypothetical protein
LGLEFVKIIINQLNLKISTFERCFTKSILIFHNSLPKYQICLRILINKSCFTRSCASHPFILGLKFTHLLPASHLVACASCIPMQCYLRAFFMVGDRKSMWYHILPRGCYRDCSLGYRFDPRLELAHSRFTRSNLDGR